MYECTSVINRDFYAHFPVKKITETYITVFATFITLNKQHNTFATTES